MGGQSTRKNAVGQWLPDKACLREKVKAVIKILVVDDSEITLAELKNILESDRIEIITALDGRSGMLAFEANPDISLIFTDINMPIMGGLEMCEAIQNKYKKIPPVLAITTEINQEIKDEAKKVGVIAWLVKPFDPKTLPAIAEQLIARFIQ